MDVAQLVRLPNGKTRWSRVQPLHSIEVSSEERDGCSSIGKVAQWRPSGHGFN